MATKPPADLYDKPLDIGVYRRAVILLGPGGVALAMTAAAAERSAEILQAAARKARRGSRAG
jgi:hypothetical protein